MKYKGTWMDHEYGEGRSTGFDGLTKMLRGWRMGELTVWSGSSGSGKTTLLNQSMMHVVREHGYPVFIASMEMLPEQLLAWMLSQHGVLGPESKIRSALESLSGGIYLLNHTGLVKPDWLLDVMAFAARKYGCKHFVIDSLMRVSIEGSDKWDAQSTFLNSTVDFAHDHKAHVHLVAHPRKGATDDDKPGKVDIAGAGDITNLAHNVLIMYRPTEDRKMAIKAKAGYCADATLYVRKNRMHGTTGSIDLEYNANTRVYRERDLSNL